MKAWLLILALILPAQGQTDHPKPSPNRATAQDPQKPSKQQQTATPSIGTNVVNEQATATEQDGAQDKPKSYLSRLFAPENLPNIILVAFAGAGIIVAICTLKEMARQRSVMQGQLAAMQSQLSEMKKATETLISKERARIRVEPGELTIKPISGTTWVGWVDMKITNLGAAKAFPSLANGYICLGKSSEPSTPAGALIVTLVDAAMIIPDQMVEKRLFYFTDMTSESIRAINEETAFMHLSGEIRYTDAFGSYVTPFRYIWTVTNNFAIATGEMLGKKIDVTRTLYGEWRKGGTEADNAAT